MTAYLLILLKYPERMFLKLYISLTLSFSFLLFPSFLYNIKMLNHKRIYHVKKCSQMHVADFM